ASATQLSELNYLRALLTAELNQARRPYGLLGEFLRNEDYDRGFCLDLLALAGRSTGVTWGARRLAVLMLEHQLLKLAPDRIDEYDLLLTRLNLKPAHGARVPLFASVLKEGYTTTALAGFVQELRRRLARLARVHERIKGPRTTGPALRDFLELSRRECKLTLARYVFSPEEVVARILKQVEVSGGVKDINVEQPRHVEGEVARSLAALPDFEAAILKKLCAESNVYWVADETKSEINSLVEYPLTTVVVVVKPPGSDLEFEIKRAGRKGPNRLRVVYARGGYTVSPSHRLDGGSMLALLRFETNAATKLALLYRTVHDEEAPVAGYHARTTISSVPVKNSPAPVLSYFTDARVYGAKYDEMHTAMEESVAAFREEGYVTLKIPRRGLGLTAQFISDVAPAQTILSGTSSFRLDKLALYLSAHGPEKYFAEGLRAEYSAHDARRLADELLEEVLGVYRPPRVRFQSYGQYVNAAFASRENRARADETYLSLVEQLGKFWGTLLAVRGYSRGESFVARNVGLKSVWRGGRWRVQAIFMDHDALVIPGLDNENFLAQGALPNMRMDERYIWGGSNPAQCATSEVGYLRGIYRTSAAVNARGEILGQRALKAAYVKTQREVLNNPALRKMFHRTFLGRLGDWDEIVTGYLRVRRDESERAAWQRVMKRKLAEKGYRRGGLEGYLEVIESYLVFVEKYAFLFDRGTPA
ncbi:MAG TPA: hypothetical protein VJT74_01120, partial [Pyrinomonadaceae bacterium]|nr:hypothetical protein [Pyrinomonadaceae bacterium]